MTRPSLSGRRTFLKGMGASAVALAAFPANARADKATASSSSGTGVYPLDGAWKIATDPGNAGKTQKWFAGDPVSGARDAVVPGVLEQSFPSYDGVVWYWKDFDAPSLAATECLRVHFAAADYFAEAWVNGEYLGSAEGGETPFSFDITSKAKTGPNNRLAVRLINPGNQRVDGMVLDEIPHGIKHAAMFVGNYWNTGGLWQGVELRRVPAVRIDDLFVTADRATGTVQAEIRVANDAGKPMNGRLVLNIAPATEGAVLVQQVLDVAIPLDGATAKIALTLDRARSWSFNDPYLYRVTAMIEANGSQHVESVRTGFRDFVFRDGYFRLNGQRTFLKFTHTIGNFPIGLDVPHDPELVRRELIYAKAMGFNMMRTCARTLFPAAIDLCDELGLMVYQECHAAWNLRDSPDMKRRYDNSVRQMILRDRSHPSVVAWGMLNETVANPTFHHAVESLPLVRSVDPSRLVLLSSGRWDGEWSTGSIANPGSTTWEDLLGPEAPDGPSVGERGKPEAGDLHYYPIQPWPQGDLDYFRTIGTIGTKTRHHVLLSEQGNGSQIDPTRIVQLMQQNGATPDLDDYKLYDAMRVQMERDWKAWGLDRYFTSHSDIVEAGMAKCTGQREFTITAIRSNPSFVGYGLCSLSDAAIEGEGLMTQFRELKPGVVEAIGEAFAPVRWCLFTSAPHVYRETETVIEAVLVNEDVLKPGSYPIRLKVVGPEGIVFEKTSTLEIADPQKGPEPSLVLPAFLEKVPLKGPAGDYEVAVTFDHGAAATARETIIAGDPASLPTVKAKVALTSPHAAISRLLTTQGATIHDADPEAPIIIIPETKGLADGAWLPRIQAGGVALILNSVTWPGGEGRGAPAEGGEATILDASAAPGTLRGRINNWSPIYWGRDDIVKPHPIFEGLPSRQIMDFHFYRDIIARHTVVDFDPAAENVVPCFAIGKPYAQGYWAGSNLLIYPVGKGRVIVSTLRILDNVGKHPVADRLLVNLVNFAAKTAA